MAWSEILGIVTGLLSVAGVIVAVTRYITKLQLEVKLERLENEKNQLDQNQANLRATNKLLLDELSIARRTGAAASAKKSEIDRELANLMQMTQASGGSVYLPNRSDNDQVTDLVFLSLLPVNDQTLKLRRKIIPLKSLAGKCFTDAQSFTLSNSLVSPDHFTKADAVSGYHSEDILCVPLFDGNEAVGVLQLLNRQQGQFDDACLALVEQLSNRLARKVAEFTEQPGFRDLLGVNNVRKTEYATLLFSDLTNSSQLFNQLNVTAAIHHINEYLEGVCSVAFKYGATVDKYMGDGVLLRFNVPQAVDNHPQVAVEAALEMSRVFEQIKQEWLTMGEDLTGVYFRAGLAYGPVQQATIGHPQYQYQTLFGPAVNAAVNLCQSGPRDRNVVIIDEQLQQLLPEPFQATQLPASNLGKAAQHTEAVYEVTQPKH
ncbi:GAF domain-containing protein [Motiliproteus sediminis]|uniref:GAF domain-containing protein n=1 Tax=Motiliproteus sediminis TaxID=1468178 RepID=UPI001AEFCC03|nr:adenylate/guanylate cyclase domain-containing protein [Motiliproteus sediminis]